MSVNKVNSDGSLSRVAGGTLYADAPIGTISPFGGSTIPNGYLLCDGTAVSRTTYAELFAVIGISFGSGDGSTSFNLPDLRETVPVGAGRMTGRDVGAHDVYAVGGFKDDQLQGHWHGEGTTSICNAESRVGKGFINISNNEWTNKTDDFTKDTSSDGVNGEPRTGTTTHGKQLGVNYIIKAKQVAVPTDFSESLVGYMGKETAYNLHQWSDTRAASTDPSSYLDFTVDQDGWYSVDFSLAQSDNAANGFAIRDFDGQGETHTIGRGEVNGCTYYRSNIIVPLKAGTYRYQHTGKGTLNVYMNHRDFA